MKSIFVACLSLSLLLLSSFTDKGVVGYRINDEASDFKLKNVDGRFVSLSDYKSANGFIVIFTCNHCPYSVAYEDRIIALHNKYVKKGFPVVAINSNDPESYPEDSFDNMKKRATSKKFPFAYLFDETQEYAKEYGAIKTPHVFLLRKSGKQLIVSYIGSIDDNTDEPESVTKKYVEMAIEQIIKGEEISVTSTKAIGCSIKWKK